MIDIENEVQMTPANVVQAKPEERLLRILKALADQTRLQLLGGMNGDRPVEELVKGTGLKQPSVSHHIQVLRKAGLITVEKYGTWAYYRTNPETIIEVCQLLVAAYCWEQRELPKDESADKPVAEDAPEGYLTIAQTAALFRVTEPIVQSWIDAGALRAEAIIRDGTNSLLCVARRTVDELLAGGTK